MKIGFNLLLWAKHITEADFHLLETLKKVGYDGVEVPLFEGDLAHYTKLGQALKDNGLAATAVTAMPDTAHDITRADPRERQGGADHIRWAVDNTAALGGTLLGGPIHQALGHFTGQARTAEEWERAVEVMRSCADHAAAAGIALSVEPLNRFECYFLNTINDSAAFVQQVGKPNVGVLYDTFHANIEEKHPVGALREHLRWINHVQVSANDRGTPGKDHIPWAATFAILKDNGYDGWLTVEAFGRALPDLAAATKVWRDFFPSKEEVYNFGYDFIRNAWDNS
jgi:D-psicose/D-tagatose/L-ribulose 3-epimerase